VTNRQDAMAMMEEKFIFAATGAYLFLTLLCIPIANLNTVANLVRQFKPAGSNTAWRGD